jgi:ABC-type bacteriocin/lantibiotic exporter with double-glycine peptidase domain
LFILKKGLAKLLLNIPTTILVLCVALILLPFYNGYLLFVDFLVLLGFATIYVVGKGFVSVGVVESGFKYQLITSFIDYTQQNKNENKHDDVTLLDQRMYDYAVYREKHFKVLLRQFLAGYVLQITVLVTTLGLGAYLVAVAQMTIGQLIATELLVIAMLNTLDKTIDLLETFSDVCIADYKLQHLLH